jgi:hypothetical protein
MVWLPERPGVRTRALPSRLKLKLPVLDDAIISATSWATSYPIKSLRSRFDR